MERLRAQIKALEEDLSQLEARTKGAARAEVMVLREKKDEFEKELDEVERAGDEAWDDLLDGLKARAYRLKESFEQAFSRHKQ